MKSARVVKELVLIVLKYKMRLLVLLSVGILLMLLKITGFETVRLLVDGVTSGFQRMCNDAPFLAALVLFVLIVAVAVIALLLYRRLSSASASVEDVDNSKLGYDSPITDDLDDRLVRKPFVKALYRHLMRQAKNGSSCAGYLGVSGDWGEGKTSVYNLLKRYSEGNDSCEEKKLLFVEFNGWEFTENFLKHILTSLSNIVLSSNAVVGDERKRFLASIHYWSCISTGGGPFAAFMSGLFGDRWSDFRLVALESVNDAKSIVRSVLRQFKQHVVIVLDDLDRMLPKEVFELIRAIRANGDLPNVTYLALADREHLAQSVGLAMGVSDFDEARRTGLEYIKKVFPTFEPLPEVGRSQMREILKDRIVSILEYRARGGVNEFSEKSSQFDFAVSVVKTMRDIKQLVADYDFILNYFEESVEGVGTPCVEANDLLALVALRHFNPRAAEHLYEGLCSASSALAKKKLSKSGVFEFFKMESPEDNEVFWRFLLSCHAFERDPQYTVKLLGNEGAVDEPDPQIWIYQGFVKEHTARFRLFSNTFYWYFTGIYSGEEEFTKDDFHKISSASRSGKDAVLVVLRKLAEEHKLRSVCDYYPFYARDLKLFQIDSFAKAIIELGDDSLYGRDIGNIYDSLYQAFKRIFLDVCNAKEKGRGDEFLRESFGDESSCLWILSQFIYDYYQKELSTGRSLSADVISSLECRLLREISRSWTLYDHRNHDKSESLWAAWIGISYCSKNFKNGSEGCNGFKEWFGRMAIATDSYRDALIPFVNEINYDGKKHALLSLNAGDLCGFIEYNKLKNGLASIEQSFVLPGAWYAILSRLEKSQSWKEYENNAQTMVDFLRANPQIKAEVDRRLIMEEKDV